MHLRAAASCACELLAPADSSCSINLLSLTLLLQVRRLIESKRPPLPDISISAVQGMFLHMLAQSAPSKTLIEVGALGGYSAAWLASALRAPGHLFSVERDPARAAFARQNLADAGFGSLVTVLNEPALEAIPNLCRSMHAHCCPSPWSRATYMPHLATSFCQTPS